MEAALSFVQGFSSFTWILIGIATLILFRGIFRSPQSAKEGNSGSPTFLSRDDYYELYTVDNVSVNRVYPIPARERPVLQKFQVLRINSEHFLIGVYHPDEYGGEQPRFVFTGWTTEIRDDRLIQPEDLIPTIPA